MSGVPSEERMAAHIELIRSATQTLIDHVEELTELDQAIGDGDHGLNMRRGALAIQARLDELAAQTLNEALRAMGATCMSTIGGSSGPVFETLLVTLGKELPEPATAPALARAVDAGIKALTRLGKAEVGQKTRARPIATRCICPPESRVAGLASLSSMRSIRATSVTLRFTSASGVGRIGERSGKARLS